MIGGSRGRKGSDGKRVREESSAPVLLLSAGHGFVLRTMEYSVGMSGGRCGKITGKTNVHDKLSISL